MFLSGGIVLLGAVIITSNVLPLVHGEMRPRTVEQLHYLPGPHMARATALGHDNTVAKLRWIDSYPYFSHQIDAKDDSTPGTDLDQRGTFVRLYESLIALDPRFEPFYLHAATACSGLINDPHAALMFLSRGVQELPQSPLLWVNLLAHLRTYYGFEELRPQQMRAQLQAWRAAMDDPDLRALPERWLAGMDTRARIRAPLVDHWIWQLDISPPTGEGRELAQAALVRAIRRFHQDLLGDMLIARSPYTRPLRLADLDLVGTDHRRLLLSYSPLQQDSLGWRLRSDPAGYRWLLRPDGSLTTRGIEHRDWLAELDRLRRRIRALRVDGVRIDDAADLQAQGLHVPAPPPGGSWHWSASGPVADGAPLPADPPWDLDALQGSR